VNLNSSPANHVYKQGKMAETAGTQRDGIDNSMLSPTKSPLLSPNYLQPQLQPQSKQKSTFQKRPQRPNSLLERSSSKSSQTRSETRRKLFLQNVASKRDEANWKRRNGAEGEDELMRVLWSGERAREIARLQHESDVLQDEEDNLEEVMVDEVDYLERMALEALVERQNEIEGITEAGAVGRGKDVERDSIYGSDEDEYDSIFMDVIEEEIRMSQSQTQGQGQDHVQQQHQQQHQQQQGGDDQDMMDLS
jgi:hypothetical protein